MLRRLYEWTLKLAAHRRSLWILAVISFAESSFFPITPLVMLVPMVIARPDRAWTIAAICTAASVAGGVFGWWLGFALYEEIGRPILDLYGKAAEFQQAAEMFRANGFGAVFIAAFTPFPYKVITIASGVASLPLATLIAASILGRGLQFFIAAAVLWYLGEPAKRLLDRYFGIAATLLAILLIGGFVAVKMIA